MDQIHSPSEAPCHTDMRDYTILRASIFADQTSSTWLRKAISSLDPRDPVDAANDLEVLSRLIELRCEAAATSARPQAEARP